MANPGLGFLFLLGAGILTAVGLLYAGLHTPQSNNGGSTNYTPNNSWTNGNEQKKRKGRKKPVNETDCSICYSTDSKCDFRLNCGHLFHLNCLLKWTEMNKTCPNCRASLEDIFCN